MRNRYKSIRFTPEPYEYNVYDGLPHQGLSEARRAVSFLNV